MAASNTDDDASRVLVVDNHRMVREGISARLAAVRDLHVIGQAENRATALAEIERLKPDVVVLDLQLNDGSGLDLARELATTHPSLVVVLHTATNITTEQFESSRAAAVALKQLIGDTLVETLRRAVRAMSSEPSEC